MEQLVKMRYQVWFDSISLINHEILNTIANDGMVIATHRVNQKHPPPPSPQILAWGIYN